MEKGHLQSAKYRFVVTEKKVVKFSFPSELETEYIFFATTITYYISGSHFAKPYQYWYR